MILDDETLARVAESSSKARSAGVVFIDLNSLGSGWTRMDQDGRNEDLYNETVIRNERDIVYPWEPEALI
jgi:hypothetical protein